MTLEAVHTRPYLPSRGMDIEKVAKRGTLKPVHTVHTYPRTYACAHAGVIHENRYGQVWTGQKEGIDRGQIMSIPMDGRYGQVWT